MIFDLLSVPVSCVPNILIPFAQEFFLPKFIFNNFPTSSGLQSSDQAVPDYFCVS